MKEENNNNNKKNQVIIFYPVVGSIFGRSSVICMFDLQSVCEWQN